VRAGRPCARARGRAPAGPSGGIHAARRAALPRHHRDGEHAPGACVRPGRGAGPVRRPLRGRAAGAHRGRRALGQPDRRAAPRGARRLHPGSGRAPAGCGGDRGQPAQGRGHAGGPEPQPGLRARRTRGDPHLSDLLWQKPGVEVDAAIQAFLAGDDVVLDREFFLFDLQASAVHAEGLARIGLLSGGEREAIARELEALGDDFRSGAFVLDDRFEDGHSAIEARLVGRLGDTGKRIHAGRSRNDQVLVATRLWLKDRLGRLQAILRQAAVVALDRAAAEADLPMPGYTHLQRAVVSSAGMRWAGWAEAFIDDAVRARDTRDWIDANPMGTAAGYGVNLPLDRDHATGALGFGRLQVAATYAQLSRGKFELAAIEALGSAMLDLRRLAWDIG